MQPQRTTVARTRGRGSLPKSPSLRSWFALGHLSAAKHTKVPKAAAAREATLLLNPATFAAETRRDRVGAAKG